MNRWCWAGLAAGAAAVIAVIVAFACCALDLDSPEEALCPQGDVLGKARLLEKAEETYANAQGEGEKCGERDRLEQKLAEAEKHFAVANVYAAASPAREKLPNGKPKPGQPNKATTALSSKKAVDEFADGLELNPFDKGASEHLTQELKKGLITAKAQCETGSNLATSGLLDAAGIALAKGLEAGNEECEKGVEKLRTQLTEATNQLRLARQQSNRETVRTTYAEALLANANLGAARTGLEDTIDGESCLDKVGSVIAGIPDLLKTGLAWAAPLAVVLLLLALLAWIGIREASARWRWARRLFEGLGAHPGFSFVQNAAVPDIEIKPFDGKGEGDLVGADFSALLVAELSRPGREPLFPFDRIARGAAPETVGANVTELLSEIPVTKVLGAIFKVVSRLFRRRKILLTGHLTPPSDEGAGVLLSVEGSRRGLNKTVTLRERTYDPKPGGKGATRWLRLIPAAGVWARWHLEAAQDRTRELKALTWEADALFQTAQAWQLKEDQKRARSLYLAALERDPRLLSAAHNLAVLEVRGGEYVRGRKREEELRTVLVDDREKPETEAAGYTTLWPTLDTASLYNLMLAWAYPEIDEEAKAKGGGNLDKAVAEGRELVKTLTHELEPTSENEERKAEEAKRDPTIAEQLELAELPSVVVLASIAIRTEEDQWAKAISCAVSDGSGVPRISRRQLRESVDTRKPWELIHGYVRTPKNLSRRTHYNLACYYTTLLEFIKGSSRAKQRLRKECQDLALESLEAALVGGALVEWARKDPSLAPLGDSRQGDLDKLLDTRTIAAHEDEEKPAKSKDDAPAIDPRSLSGRIARIEERGKARFGQ